MKMVVGVLLGFLILGAVAALVVVAGAYDVSASVPASKLETRLATYALNRSVAKRAPKTKNPLAATPEVLREGLSHYRENCVVCHGAPGVDASELGAGLNPPAPDLTLPRVQNRPDGELFWITSKGIRMTGMPAFEPTHRPDEVWRIVAFLRHLPELTPEEERELEKAAEGGKHHHGEASPAKEKSGDGHTHAPGTPPHND